VTEAVLRAVEAGRESAASRGIRVELQDDGAGARVLADREALAMIYSNLVENAVKYSRDGGEVRVRVWRDGMYVGVSVRDRGIGISPEDCGKIFDEFYRARTEETAAIPGTGLGLSLVRRLTELHEGTVSVSSELGTGSEFTVRLPLAGPTA